MNYFTPELIVAYGSDDPNVWRDAEKRWDAACDAYDRYLASVNADFPPGLRRLEADYYLHDAVVRGIGQRDGAFVIQLQLDTPPQSLVTITYDLIDAPTIDREALPPDCRTTGDVVDWQYHETERVEGSPFTWRHSILLSNGWELGLHFRDVHVEEARALLPAPRNGTPTSSVPELSPSA